MKQIQVKTQEGWKYLRGIRDNVFIFDQGNLTTDYALDIKLVDDEQQTPDEKVLDYLERANNLYKKMDVNTRVNLGKNWLIEIAKLLQSEESK